MRKPSYTAPVYYFVLRYAKFLLNSVKLIIKVKHFLHYDCYQDFRFLDYYCDS